MAMNHTELKEAFRTGFASQFSEVPAEEWMVEHEFSPAFEQRMQRLIRKQRHPLWRLVNTASKRAAVIVVTVAALLSVVFGVKALREPLIHFFVETYESFVQYFTAQETPPDIQQEYRLHYVPEGYTLFEKMDNKNLQTVIYRNEQGHTIKFVQKVDDGGNYVVDNEYGKEWILAVGEQSVNIYEGETTICAIWVQDTYCFKIITTPPLPIDKLEAMITSVF